MKNHENNNEGLENSEEIIPGALPGDVSIRKEIKRIASLKRTLGVYEIFSIAYGNLGSSIYYALGVTALYAMGATPLVFMLASIFFIFTAASYAEGTAAIPEAGGSSSFARKAFNELVSFIAGWCLLLGYIVTISIASFAAVNYLSYLKFFEFLRTSPWNMVGEAGVLLILMIINVVGTRISAAFSKVLTFMDIATQALLVLLGVFLFLNVPDLLNRIHWGIAPTWHQLIISFYIVMVSFTGIETISNLAEESKEPGKTIPKSIWRSVGTSLVMFFLVSSIALSAMPVEFRIEGYVYARAEDLDPENSAVSSGTSRELIYHKELHPHMEGKPVQGVVVKITEAHPENRISEPWLVETDKNGYFQVKELGLGKYNFKLYKKGFKEKEFTFDTSDLNSMPLNGKWTTDLTMRWINDPVAGIADTISKKLKISKGPLGTWVALLAFTVLILATNSGILGVSRLIFSMGSHNQVPPILAEIHSKFRTPYVAIILFTIVAFLIVLPADIEKLAQVYAFAALISYTIAHVSIIALRIKYPDMVRPFKIPFNISISGKAIPISAIIGGIACFTLWLIVAYYKDYGRNVGTVFILCGILIYWIYRNSIGMKLIEDSQADKERI